MRLVDLDYQRRRRSSGRAVGFAVLALGMMFAVLVTVEDWRLGIERSGLEARLAQLQPQGPQRRGADAAREQEFQRAIKRADALMAELARPWDELFHALEHAKTDDVALLAIEPDAAKSVVRIVGEARRREDLLAFIDRLKQEPALDRVFLVDHQILKQVAQRPVRFSVTAVWAKAS